jgi:predicted RNA-binding Zn ribbon-like protein
MKLRELLELVEELLSTKKSEQMTKKADLEILLKKLRKKEKALKEELASELDMEKKQTLENKIALAHTQRKKGLVALAALKNVS